MPADLADLAAQANQSALLYKTDARSAARARATGWSVMAIAREAIIVPARFDPNAAACRALRRKLRAAAATGLRVERATGPLPLAAMARVSAAWVGRNRRERGFSMGRFHPGLLAGAAVFLAWQGGALQGFVSLNRGAQDWALDLMRVVDTAPDGTMHALVAAAIAAAARDGVPRLSLAAVPLPPTWLPPRLHRLVAAPGLLQFKRTFGPTWVTRYACGPSGPELVRGLLAVTCAVHRPAAMPGPLAATVTDMRPLHDDDAEIRFETPRVPCDGVPQYLTFAPPARALAPAPRARPSQGAVHDHHPKPCPPERPGPTA